VAFKFIIFRDFPLFLAAANKRFLLLRCRVSNNCSGGSRHIGFLCWAYINPIAKRSGL